MGSPAATEFETLPRVRSQGRIATPLMRLQIALGLAAILSAAIYTSLGVRYPITGGGETIAITNSLLKTGVFGNPFAAGDTGPSALLPPFYPLLRAALAKMFAGSALSVSLLLTLLMHAIHAALLPRMSLLLFDRAAPGICAALAAIALPLFDVLHWDAMYVAVGLLVFCLYSAKILLPPAVIRTGGCIGAGFGAALLLLANPTSIFAMATWLAALAWRRQFDRPVRRALCLIAVCMFVGCVPWTVRNYLTFHRLLPIRDNFGMQLYISNNDCSGATTLENLRNGCHDRLHAMVSKTEVALIQKLGEVEYNSDRLRIALAWIQAHPRNFLWLCGRRFVEFWFPSEAYPFWLLTFLAIPGTILLAVRDRWTAQVTTVICALFPLLYYFAETSPRYRYPIMWITLLQAGYFVDWSLRRFWAPARASAR